MNSEFKQMLWPEGFSNSADDEEAGPADKPVSMDDEGQAFLSNAELNALGAAPDPEANPQRYVPFEHYAWDEEGEDIADTSWCFLCEMSPDVHAHETNVWYQRLVNIIQEHYGKCQPMVLARKVQNFYNQELREHTLEQKPWALQTIFEHIEQHAPTPLTMATQTVRVLSHCINVLKDNNMCLEDTVTGKRSLDTTNTRLFLQLVQQRSKSVREMRSYQLGHHGSNPASNKES